MQQRDQGENYEEIQSRIRLQGNILQVCNKITGRAKRATMRDEAKSSIVTLGELQKSTTLVQESREFERLGDAFYVWQS